MAMRRPTGNWTPAHLTRSDCTVLIFAVCALGVSRGLDYVIGEDSRPRGAGSQPAVVLLNDALTLPFWGYLILGFTALLCAGAWTRRHVLVYLGHGFLMAIYFALFVGTLLPILSNPYADGWRGATALLGPVVVHFLFWLRTGPRPISSGDAYSTETTRAPRG